MNTQQLVALIQINIEYCKENIGTPRIIYLDNINYHKLDYYVNERRLNTPPYEPKPKELQWEGLRVFKVDTQEVHVNVC